MPVARFTEIIASSNTSFEDAVAKGIARAVETLQNVEGRVGQGPEGHRQGRQDCRISRCSQGDLHPDD